MKENIKKMKIKGVFFDLYGTLLIYHDMPKAWSSWLTTFYECLKNYGLKLSINSFAQYCDGFFEETEPIHQNDDLTVFEHLILRLCTKLNLNISKEGTQSTAYSLVNTWQKFVTLDPNTIPVLTKLKKDKKLALITNFDHPPHIYELLSNMDLDHYFNSITISSEIGVKKPNPKIFKYALENIGLENKEVIYIGDSPEDIEGGFASGIMPIFIRREVENNGVIFTDFKQDHSISDRFNDQSLIKKAKVISDLVEIFNFI
jgi:putative hydrolase of the HAD superfamily